MATINSLAEEFGCWPLDLINYLRLSTETDTAREMTDARADHIRRLWLEGSPEITARIMQMKADEIAKPSIPEMLASSPRLDPPVALTSTIDAIMRSIQEQINEQTAVQVRAAIEYTGRRIGYAIDNELDDTIGESDEYRRGLTDASRIVSDQWQKVQESTR